MFVIIFLPAEKAVNLFVQPSYQYSMANGGYNQAVYSLSTGPAFYFNPNVGMEFTLGYSVLTYPGSNQLNWQVFKVGVGFQIHLEKK